MDSEMAKDSLTGFSVILTAASFILSERRDAIRQFREDSDDATATARAALTATAAVVALALTAMIAASSTLALSAWKDVPHAFLGASAFFEHMFVIAWVLLGGVTVAAWALTLRAAKSPIDEKSAKRPKSGSDG